MMILHEKALFAGTMLEVELHDDLRYHLRYGDLVEYVNNEKTVKNRSSPYPFRSVEQLRYDFERDVLAAGGHLAKDS